MPAPMAFTMINLLSKSLMPCSLPPEAYAANPQVRYQAKNEVDRALRNVLGYRLYRDLKRGWRITSPNLEQCGLLEIQLSGAGRNLPG